MGTQVESKKGKEGKEGRKGAFPIKFSGITLLFSFSLLDDEKKKYILVSSFTECSEMCKSLETVLCTGTVNEFIKF